MHVGETGQHGEPLPPAGFAIARAEGQPGAEGLTGAPRIIHQAEHRLGHDQRDLLLQPHFQPVALARESIGRRREVDPDRAVPHLDRIGRHVVGPQVEAAAAGQVEAGVMPVAGKNPVTERAAIEREAHVRAAVVDGVDAVLVAKDRQGVALYGDRQLAALLEIGEAGGTNERWCCGRHSVFSL